MFDRFFYQRNYIRNKDTEIHFILHNSGDIQPLDIHNKARIGFTGLDARASNIMKGIDSDGNECFIMYSIDIKYIEKQSVINHRIGYTTVPAYYTIWDAQGEGKLHKFYSADGLTWAEWENSPQTVWYKSGNNLVEAFYELDGQRYLPIPYLTSEDTSFSGQSKDGF